MFVKFLRKYGDHMNESSNSFLFIGYCSLLIRYVRCQDHHSRLATGHLTSTWTLHHVTTGMCKYFSPALPIGHTGTKPPPSLSLSLFFYIYIYCSVLFVFHFIKKFYICHQIHFFLSCTYTLSHLYVSLLCLSNQ